MRGHVLGLVLAMVAVCDGEKYIHYVALESDQTDRGRDSDGHQDYTMTGSISVQGTATDLGCIECDSTSDGCVKDIYKFGSMWVADNADISIQVSFRAWEDDTGSRCTYDSSGDDAYVSQSCTINPEDYTQYTNHYVTCTGSQAALKVRFNWYTETLAPATPSPPTPFPATSAPPTPLPTTDAPPTPAPTTYAPVTAEGCMRVTGSSLTQDTYGTCWYIEVHATTVDFTLKDSGTEGAGVSISGGSTNLSLSVVAGQSTPHSISGVAGTKVFIYPSAQWTGDFVLSWTPPSFPFSPSPPTASPPSPPPTPVPSTYAPVTPSPSYTEDADSSSSVVYIVLAAVCAVVVVGAVVAGVMYKVRSQGGAADVPAREVPLNEYAAHEDASYVECVTAVQ